MVQERRTTVEYVPAASTGGRSTLNGQQLESSISRAICEPGYCMRSIFHTCLIVLAFLIVRCSDTNDPGGPFQEPPLPPRLIKPYPDTALPCDVACSVNFDWTTVQAAEIYELQTDTLAHFGTAMTHQKNPPAQVTLLRYGPRTTYYWRVRAGNALWTESYTDWSEIYQFDLIPEARGQ
jgi:hypothetical protein